MSGCVCVCVCECASARARVRSVYVCVRVCVCARAPVCIKIFHTTSKVLNIAINIITDCMITAETVDIFSLGKPSHLSHSRLPVSAPV